VTALPVIPITHSIVAATAIEAEIGRRWGLERPYCELMSRGVNDYYLVRSAGQLYAARLMRHKLRSDLRNRYEAQLARFYFDRGFRVTAPIPGLDGELVHHVLAPEGPRALSLFTWAEGRPMSRDERPIVAERLGAMVARMHRVAHEFRIAERHVVDKANYIRERVPALQRMLADHPEDRAYYPPLIERVAHALDAIDRKLIPFGATHNDIHVDNVLVGDDGEPTIIDWDNSGDDYFAKELTHFLWRNVYAGRGEEQSRAFLRGYEAVRPLSADEKALMPLFLLARHFNILCGMAAQVNVVGHTAVGYNHSLPRYRVLIGAAAKEAGFA
jgi:Ser/Thr protein kinase RdoA (MazF antagonist)